MEGADAREDEAMLQETSVMFMGHFQERSRLRLYQVIVSSFFMSVGYSSKSNLEVVVSAFYSSHMFTSTHQG